MPLAPGQQISATDFNSIAQPYYAQKAAYGAAGIPFGSITPSYPSTGLNLNELSASYIPGSIGDARGGKQGVISALANPVYRANGGGSPNPNDLSDQQIQNIEQYGSPNGPNQVVNGAINGMYGTGKQTITQAFPQTQNVKNQSISDFTTQLLAQKPQQQAANQSQQNFIGSVYSDGGAGSVSGQLDQLAQQKAGATNEAARQAMGTANRTYNLNRMQGGNNSYLDRAYGDSLASIAAQQARHGAAIPNLEPVAAIRCADNGLDGHDQPAIRLPGEYHPKRSRRTQ